MSGHETGGGAEARMGARAPRPGPKTATDRVAIWI